MNKRESTLILFSIGAIFSACIFVGIYGNTGIPVSEDIEVTTFEPATTTPSTTVSTSPTSVPVPTTSTPIIPTPAPSQVKTPTTSPSPLASKATPASETTTPTPKAMSTDVKPTGNPADDSMQKDLVNIVGLGVLPALSIWNYEPTVDTLIVFNPKTFVWSISDKARVLYSGKTSIGNIFSGLIKMDGSFCVQAQNPKGTSLWRLDSITGELIKGNCP